MKIARLALIGILSSTAGAEEAPPGPKVIVKAARLFDGKSDRAQPGLAVLVEGDRIGAVGAPAALARAAPGAKVIELGGAMLMPGLIDGHTHLLVSSENGVRDYGDHLLKESGPYRAIVGTANARTALLYGFTSPP